MYKYQSDSAILPFSRCKSVEVISEEEIKSDGEIPENHGIPKKTKKRKIVKNAMSGFCLRYDLTDEEDIVTWQR